MTLGISSVANHIMDELHVIATLSQICFVSQFSVTFVFRKMCILVLQKTGCQKLKSKLMLEKKLF